MIARAFPVSLASLKFVPDLSFTDRAILVPITGERGYGDENESARARKKYEPVLQSTRTQIGVLPHVLYKNKRQRLIASD